MPALPLGFDRPAFLLLVPAALALVWWGARKSLAHWTPRQALLCMAVRSLVLALIGCAVAGPRWLSSTSEVAVVFLRDVSASVPPEARSRAAQFGRDASALQPDRSAEVIFAARPELRHASGGKGKEEKPPPADDATDISSALEFAAAILPADRPGRIVLLSDGRDTAGRSPVGVVPALGKVEIDTWPAVGAPRPDVSVAAITPPPHLREGEVFDLRAKIHAATAMSGVVVRLFQDNLKVAEQKLDTVPAGGTEVVFPRVRGSGRLTLYEVEVAGTGDEIPGNNRKKIAVAQKGRAQVLIIDENAALPLADALRAGDFEVEVRPPRGFPASMEELEAFDLVVFSDVPATAFSGAQMEMLEKWVKEFGGGFLMTGGENSFGAGGYFGTPVATLLPLRVEHEQREETPIVALLVVLDRSGSMSAPAGGETKMSLANEGAVLALGVLKDRDLFGLLAVDTAVQEVVPLGPAADKREASRRISAITAGGGGIYIYTSLAAAYPLLRDAQAKVKHVILFSDASDAEEKTANAADGGASALDLSAAMLSSRITLSVVALGTDTDRDTAFLRQLSAQGGGRFYLTADATSLPRIFTLETMRAAGASLREEALQVQSLLDSDLTRGIDWGQSPLLLGLNLSSPKPGAELLLAGEKGEPVLAAWRYGLGRVAAFTSDAKARWSSEWLSWPGYGKLWTQVARDLSRGDDRQDLDVRVIEENGRLVVNAEALGAAGTYRNSLDLSVAMAASGTSPVTKAEQVAPGLYRASLPMPAEGAALVVVSDGAGAPVSRAWVRDYPAEYQVAADGLPLLKELSTLTAGRHEPSLREVFRPAARPVALRRDLAPFFVLLALLLWPADIWLRRRDWVSWAGNSLPPFSRAN